MTTNEALEKLDQLQTQIVHGGTPFKDIADAVREVLERAEYAEKAFKSDQRLMFAALKILRDNGIEVGSKELCEAARRIIELERNADAVAWQPIESCPKDGSAFMAFQPHEQDGFVFPATVTKAGRIVDTLDGNAYPRATHWRPLPAYPENSPAQPRPSVGCGESSTTEKP